MGEKIRDIREINLLGTKLMVELNEGYSSAQGNLIHIQNNKFRYLLTEKDFYKFASDIMRAAVELSYIKTHLPKVDIKIPKYEREATDISQFKFVSALQNSEITYRILETRAQLVTILVSPNELKAFHKLAKTNKMKSVAHPYGKRYGFIFLYQMKPFELYEKDGMYYEIFCQIPSKSLTPKMWMPLDKMVQTSIWDNKKTIDGIDYVIEEDLWIFRLVQCLFMQIELRQRDIDFFSSHKEVLESSTLKAKLELIVFGYADKLLELMNQEQYDKLVTDYFSYDQY